MRFLSAVCMVFIGAVMLCAQASRSQGVPANETATQFYERYLAAIQHAESVNEIVAFWTPAQAEMFLAAPANERVSLADLKRMNAAHPSVKVTKETPTGSVVVLTLESISGNKTLAGTARVVKIGGDWKLEGPERWAF